MIMSNKDLNKMIKNNNEKIKSQTQMIEKLRELFISADLIEKEINEKPEKEIIDGINHNKQLHEIMSTSGCDGLDNYWVAWLFQELEDKALSEINKLLLSLQVQHVEELRELGINESILKKTKAFKILKNNAKANDIKHKEVRSAKDKIREEYKKNKKNYENRWEFIDDNYEKWKKEYPKLSKKLTIFNDYLKHL